MAAARLRATRVAGVVASLVALDGPAPNKSSKVNKRPRRWAAALSACAVRMTGALYQKPNRLRFHIQTRNQILYIPFPFPSVLNTIGCMATPKVVGQPLIVLGYYRGIERSFNLNTTVLSEQTETEGI